MNEEWRLVVGFQGYEVSSLGRVRGPGGIKKPHRDRKGYLSVTLWIKQRRLKRAVQRLVAEAFIGPRTADCVVRHRNGVNDDNAATNLRYGTHAENEADKREHGTALFGEKHHQAKLTEAKVREIRRRFVHGSRSDGQQALAREFGVSNTLIRFVVTRKLWAHIA